MGGLCCRPNVSNSTQMPAIEPILEGEHVEVGVEEEKNSKVKLIRL